MSFAVFCDSDQLLNPRVRDNDKDGIPNYLDHDDNNNGVPDDQDPNQYQQSPTDAPNPLISRPMDREPRSSSFGRG